MHRENSTVQPVSPDAFPRLTADRLRVGPITHRKTWRATVVGERWLVFTPLAAVIKPAQISQDLVLDPHLVIDGRRVRLGPG